MIIFYEGRSIKHKKIDNWTVFFALLGSAHAKAARKMLRKSTTGVVDEDLSEGRRDSLDGRRMVANIAKAVRQRPY
jgi:hypothetical protein